MSGVRGTVPLLAILALAGCASFTDPSGRHPVNSALQQARQEHAAAAGALTNAILRYCAVRYETEGGRHACHIEKQRELEETLGSPHEGWKAHLYAARPGATDSSLRCETVRGQTTCDRPRSADAEAWRKHVFQ